MEPFIITALLSAAILFFLAELFFLPGLTVSGILGLVSSGIGIYLSYSYYGNMIGHFVFGGFTVSCAALIYFGLHARVWKGFTLEDSLEGKVKNLPEDIYLGAEGRTIAALRPYGTASFNNVTWEVRSLEGQYIPPNEKVCVEKIEGIKVWVKKMA